MNDVFKALADPTRRAILEMLREREMTAGDIADCFTLAKPTLSGHLAVLLAADLVHRERIGTTLVYHLKLSVLEEAWLRLASTMRLGKSDPSCSTDTAPASPSR
ncbi:autorepressor SdpR family transcription factor [Acetobacter malorum]|uniref:autorepressor SdpR family transcription factor n=1 Tax=Acetobacter malorum TaxID=178901 RepID=UPI000A383DBB|nr:autorepressor SdpR family transcription factor [Acetobacter malorum]